jgi:hypothetical protein
MQIRQRWRVISASVALAGAVSVGGCGSDGLELNGALFDWMGVSSAAQQARKVEPKLADRAPLVIPPDTTRLPDPGAGQTAAAQSWPLDSEQRKVADVKERERLHMAYCRGEIQWKDRALDPQKSGVNRSPYGPCPSLVSGAASNVDFNKK